MKAIVHTQYGPPDLLALRDVERPTPAAGEVLVEVHAASVTYGNLALVKGKPFIVRLMVGGLRKPRHRIQGSDLAGRVVAAGDDVHQFRPGDEVYGDLSECGFGAYAEFVAAPEHLFALKPTNLTFEEAAAVPQAGLVALQGLRNLGRIQEGQQVLIVGASGGNGSFAVQIAKSYGAEVTGVCSTRNIELVQSLGADHVIDYTREDFARNGKRYDLIFTTGGYRSIFDYRRALKPRGSYVMAGGALKQVFEAIMLGPILSVTGGKRLVNLSQKPSQEDLDVMRSMIESGQVSAVIDRCYPLSETSQALSRYGSGDARGKVVISVAGQE
jgi:NADPH:quinone reductase-like Zn-dependent oxidoreductase